MILLPTSNTTENCGEDKDKRVIICHGNDLQTLVNQMTYCGSVDQFMQSFGRAIDFMQFDGKSKSLTKLNVHAVNIKRRSN